MSSGTSLVYLFYHKPLVINCKGVKNGLDETQSVQNFVLKNNNLLPGLVSYEIKYGCPWEKKEPCVRPLIRGLLPHVCPITWSRMKYYESVDAGPVVSSSLVTVMKSPTLHLREYGYPKTRWIRCTLEYLIWTFPKKFNTFLSNFYIFVIEVDWIT